MKNSMHRFFKHLRRLSPVEANKVVHCSNASYGLILFTSIVVSGQVFGADVKPELFHFDCERVDAGLKQPLDFNGGLILIEANGGKIWCKGRTEIVGGLFVRPNVSEANSILKIDTGNAKSETIGNNDAEQSASNTKPTRDQSKFVGSKFHAVLIILAGGFGGIIIGLSIAWWWLGHMMKTPNAQVTGASPAFMAKRPVD